jgi:phospholipid/cholesterol/gamma-HCH transport system substrate-binding protein
MQAKAQKIRVGLFAAGTLFLIGVVLIVFGGMRFWEKSDHYRIVFDDSVIGLENGAEVFMNGIKVGAVKGIEIAPEDIRKVSVTIKVKGGTPIHADTHAMLQYAGITGLKIIDLRDGTSASPTLPPGSKIAVGAGVLDKLQKQATQLVDQTEELMKKTGEVMTRAGGVMDRASTLTDNLIAVTEPAKLAATNLAEMSGSLKAMVEENRIALRGTMAMINQTATGANAMIKDTSGLIKDTSTLITGQATQLFANAGGAVADLKKLIGANEGPLRAMVFDLREASRSFKELGRDLRQRPSRLLFSNEPSERKLP